MTPPRYRVYGLNIETTRAVDLLEDAAFVEPDVRIVWGREPCLGLPWHRRHGPELDRHSSLRVDEAEADGECWVRICYRVPGGEIAVVADRHARNVTIVCGEGVAAMDRDSYFVGPILGAILRLRNILVLHASAVEIGGRAVAFVGAKRSGKSTHAAAFLRRGHRVLADDIVALVANDDGFVVQSGYSRLRVRPGTAELIAADYLSGLAPVYSERDSYYAPLADAFCAASLPLAAIYVVEQGESGALCALPPFQSISRLGQNTFGNYAMTPASRTNEFAQLCALAAEVPVRTLGVEYDIANLVTQCDAVLRDYRALAFAGSRPTQTRKCRRAPIGR